MTREQERYLQDELSRCSAWKFQKKNWRTVPMPRPVRAAKTLLARWEHSEQRRRDVHEKQYSRMRAAAKQAICLERDEKKALRLIRELQRACGE